AGRLHREELRKMLLPGHQVVNLEQVEAGDAPVPAGFLDLLSALRARGDPYLVGGEDLRRIAQLVEAVADDLLRGAVHGRGVDQATATLEEGAHHFGAGIAGGGIVPHVEGDPAPQADER